MTQLLESRHDLNYRFQSDVVRQIRTETPLFPIDIPVVDKLVQMGFTDYMRIVSRVRYRHNQAYRFGQREAYGRLVVNPFGYWCAPNAATPDYVCAYAVRDFIGFGLLCCYHDLQEIEGYTPDAQDYYWFRNSFLSAVGRAVDGYARYERNHDTQDDYHDDDFNFLSDADKIREEYSDPKDEIMFEWRPELVDSDGNLCMSLGWFEMNGTGADSMGIWAAADLFKSHRREWQMYIRHAHRLNEWLLGHKF